MWLDANDDDIRDVAMNFSRLDLTGTPDLSRLSYAELLPDLPCQDQFPGLLKFLMQPGLPACPVHKKRLWAESVLGVKVPGDSLTKQMARLSDARFWRRALRVRLAREREHFHLRLRLVGRSAEPYVSDVQLAARKAQLKRQLQWMTDTVLVPRYLDPEQKNDTLLSLADVSSSASSRFAKTYAFLCAMDSIASDAGLAAGMLTLTLEPEWHANPSHGASSWNGASPRAAHESLAKRWQSVLRDLNNLGVGISGLRVVEPHKDACPHWHVWLLYRPESEQAILETVMKYFPHKLKVRNPSAKRSKSDAKSAATLSTPANACDVIFDTLAELKANAGRAPTLAKEGAQVELARIDRSISSGAGYAMKYLLKTVDGGDKLNQQTGLFPESPEGETLTQRQLEKQAQRRAAHQANARRVDAFRGVWGINSGQLFGVSKCLTAWDTLRRLGTAPSNPMLCKLWSLARGGLKKGRIQANSGIRGDAKGFLTALGGLAACGKPPKGAVTVSIGRLTKEAMNGYGEEIKRTVGVTLVQRTRVMKVTGARTSKVTGEVKCVKAWRSVKTVLAEINIRAKEWMLVPLKNAAQAMEQLKKRTEAEHAEFGSAHLSLLAVRTFWSGVWDGVAQHNAEPQPAPLPWLLSTA
ncbi:putative bacteriophage replication protein A [Rhodoferax antarcticus ANT.BR]|uniref:Putative bacteriophage replication protein A n=1 Tax=Rhodoferax antarcticus ANT.BR TaxID=1111071 RepID=A0A1Q8YFY8_9BURK|nr:putative bacteriophage replication protein A [Rhodoferax antarcticus ANT.BR]